MRASLAHVNCQPLVRSDATIPGLSDCGFGTTRFAGIHYVEIDVLPVSGLRAVNIDVAVVLDHHRAERVDSQIGCGGNSRVLRLLSALKAKGLKEIPSAY